MERVIVGHGTESNPSPYGHSHNGCGVLYTNIVTLEEIDACSSTIIISIRSM